MKRVLIVEDNPGDYYLLRESIRAAEITCEIVHCEDGFSAIQMIEEGHINSLNLAVLDLNLPRRGGLEVLRTIRESPATAIAPVVILTSWDSAVERANAAKLGVERYYIKPLLLKDFLQIGLDLRELLRFAPEVPEVNSPEIDTPTEAY